MYTLLENLFRILIIITYAYGLLKNNLILQAVKIVHT